MLYLRNTFLVILMLVHLTASAQKEAEAAFNGYEGNYIYNIFKPASAAHPDGDVVGFRLDRKARNETTWQTLYKFSTPATFDDLQRNHQHVQNKVFEYNPATAYTIGDVWPIFKKNFNYDSLSVYLTQQHLALAFNILLLDTTAKRETIYQYRVTQLKADGAENGKYTSLPVSSNDQFPANRPKKSQRRITGDVFRMEWKAKVNGKLPEVLLIKRSGGLKMPFERILTSYSIEQRGDSVIYTVEDDKVTKDVLYQYTITPVNRFGGGATAVSDTMQVALLDQQMLIPKIFTATADSINNNIALNWSFIKPDFVGAVNIFRSTEYEGNYKLIKSTTGYNYVDRDITSGQKYYYYLVVNDRMARASERSVKIYGLSQKSDKSEAPVQVTVSKSGSGNAISWSDNASDTRGFYVYRTSEVGGALKPITEMIYIGEKAKPTYTYTDTATNLSGKIGYAVVAENLSNVRSNYSSTVYVDVESKGTSQPILVDFKLLNDGISIFWQDQTGALITTGYNVYRSINDSTYVKINRAPILAMKTSYKDVLKVNDMAVSYKITSVNASGVESEFSNVLKSTHALTVYPPSGLKSFYASDSKSIILTWQPSQSNVANYEVYRYVRGKDPVKIATIKSLTYTDTNYDINNNAYYFIKTIGINGNISLPSSETYQTTGKD